MLRVTHFTVVRCAALCICAGSLSACPSRPCTTPSREVLLAGPSADPNLGTFHGSLVWLQTGDETELTVQATPAESVAELSCESNSVEVGYEIASADGVLALSVTQSLLLRDDGFVAFLGAGTSFDAQGLAAGGKLPELSGGAGDPAMASLLLEPESDGTWSVLLVAVSSSDSLSIAAATLERMPSPR